MSRLTKSIRESMANKLTLYRYKPEAEALSVVQIKLIKQAYASLFSKKDLAAMAAFAAQFPGRLANLPSLMLNAGGYHIEMDGCVRLGYSGSIGKPVEKMLFPHTEGYRRYSLTDVDLIQEIQEHQQQLKTLTELATQAHYEALSVLEGITTGKKLAEAWPEAIPVIGDLIPEDNRTLPVVQVAAINAKFRLPPEKKAA